MAAVTAISFLRGKGMMPADAFIALVYNTL
jgi:hypothetical protein